MEQDIISVVMSVYKESIEWIEKAVRSILEQSYKNIECVILVDNPERKELQSFFAHLMQEDGRIKVFYNENNMGLARSLNKAIELSQGAYIARMDADDISLTERLYTQIEYLKRGKYDIVASNVWDLSEDIEEKLGRTRYPTEEKHILAYMKYASCAPHPTWFGKREVFIDNSYYPLEAAQDYELITRLLWQGYKLGIIEEPLLLYRINSSGISMQKKVYQRLIAYYVGQRFSKGQDFTYAAIERFLNSDEGKQREKEICYYREYTLKIKELRKRKAYIKSVLYICWLFISSPEARRMAKVLLCTGWR